MKLEVNPTVQRIPIAQTGGPGEGPGATGLPRGVPPGGDPDFPPAARLTKSSELDSAAAVLANRVKIIQVTLVGRGDCDVLLWPLLAAGPATGTIRGVSVDGLVPYPLKKQVKNMMDRVKSEGEAAWQAKLLAATLRLQGMADELRQVAEMKAIPSKARQLARISSEVASFIMAGMESGEGMEEAAAHLAEINAKAHVNIASAMAADGVLNDPEFNNSLPALTAEGLDALSISELRKMLRLHKVPTTGLLEKAEFVAVAKQFLGLL